MAWGRVVVARTSVPTPTWKGPRVRIYKAQEFRPWLVSAQYNRYIEQRLKALKSSFHVDLLPFPFVIR